MWFVTEHCRTNESTQPAVWSKMTASGSVAWFETPSAGDIYNHSKANVYLPVQSKRYLIPQTPLLNREEKQLTFNITLLYHVPASFQKQMEVQMHKIVLVSTCDCISL